ncbi:MAG TPA: peptide deformylase [Paenibacillaceae bacterium]|nr:peptide deformylase [Paenibacillaceae bacterium]
MITRKDIVIDGHPVLRQVAQDVPIPLTEEDKKTLRGLLEYVKNSQDEELAKKYDLKPGVGLAAPQIAVSKKMIGVHFTDEDGKLHSYALANPKIISHSVDTIFIESGEGCLSVEKDVKGHVPRYERIKVQAFDAEGKEVLLKLRDYAAIVLQHEIDHLQGILFYDRIDKEQPFIINE